MKKIQTILRACCALTGALLLLPFGSLVGFAEGETTAAPTFWQILGSNFWYILLVIAFGVGILLVSKWSKKINARDEQFKEEFAQYKAEHPEEFEESASGETAEEMPEEIAEAGETPNENDGTVPAPEERNEEEN